MNNLQIKEVTLNHINALQQIGIDAYSKNFKNHWDENGLELYIEKEFNTERLIKEIQSDSINWYFIEVENTNIGFIKMNLKPKPDPDIETDCELVKIYLLPKYKGKGFGKLAIIKSIENIKKLHKKALILDVIDTNKTAISFYKSLGFKIYGDTQLNEPFFKEELKGMYKMILKL